MSKGLRTRRWLNQRQTGESRQPLIHLISSYWGPCVLGLLKPSFQLPSFEPAPLWPAVGGCGSEAKQSVLPGLSHLVSQPHETCYIMNPTFLLLWRVKKMTVVLFAVFSLGLFPLKGVGLIAYPS